jgi:hypothetical protein
MADTTFGADQSRDFRVAFDFASEAAYKHVDRAPFGGIHRPFRVAVGVQRLGDFFAA